MSPAGGAVRLPDSSSANTPRMWPPLAVCHTLIAVHCPAGTSIRKMSFGSGFSTRAEPESTPPAACAPAHHGAHVAVEQAASRIGTPEARERTVHSARSHIPIARLA